MKNKKQKGEHEDSINNLKGCLLAGIHSGTKVITHPNLANRRMAFNVHDPEESSTRTTVSTADKYVTPRKGTSVDSWIKLMGHTVKEATIQDIESAIGANVASPPNGHEWKTICDPKAAEYLLRYYQKNRSSMPTATLFNQFPLSIENAPSTLCVTSNLCLDSIGDKQYSNHICGIENTKCECPKAKQGKYCEKNLREDDVVYLCGTNMELVAGVMYYVPAYKISKGCMIGCKVDYVKAMFNQVEFVTNRMAKVPCIERQGKHRGRGGYLGKRELVVSRISTALTRGSLRGWVLSRTAAMKGNEQLVRCHHKIYVCNYPNDIGTFPLPHLPLNPFITLQK